MKVSTGSYCLFIEKRNMLLEHILYRDVNWLFEIISPDILEVVEHKCSFVLRLNVNEGMFVNPDQIADLNRFNKVMHRFNVLKINANVWGFLVVCLY